MTPTAPTAAPGVSAEIEKTVSRLKRRLLECIRSPAMLGAREKFEEDLRTALLAGAAGGQAVKWTPGPNEFKDWCSQWFGPDSDDDYLAKAVFDLPPMAQRFRYAPPLPVGAPQGVTDAEILSVNDNEEFFSTSESRFGKKVNPHLQYHTGEPGLLQFSRALLARFAASRPVAGALPASPEVQAVVAAAQEWSAERAATDWTEADLMKAVVTLDGDWPGCDECDHQCDEPCMPATVAEQHISIDRQIAQLVHDGKLPRYEGYEPPVGFKPYPPRRKTIPIVAVTPPSAALTPLVAEPKTFVKRVGDGFVRQADGSYAKPVAAPQAAVDADKSLVKLRFFRDLSGDQRLKLLGKFATLGSEAVDEVRSHAHETLLFNFIWTTDLRKDFVAAIHTAIASTPATGEGAQS